MFPLDNKSRLFFYYFHSKSLFKIIKKKHTPPHAMRVLSQVAAEVLFLVSF
jgi:hypothetical protein